MAPHIFWNYSADLCCPSLTSKTIFRSVQLLQRRLTWSFAGFIAVCYSMWPYKHQHFSWQNTRWQSRLLTWIWLLMNTHCDVEKMPPFCIQVYFRSTLIKLYYSMIPKSNSEQTFLFLSEGHRWQHVEHSRPAKVSGIIRFTCNISKLLWKYFKDHIVANNQENCLT